MALNYRENFFNEVVDVFVDRNNNGKAFGHTSNYLMVHTNEKLQKGEIYNLIV